MVRAIAMAALTLVMAAAAVGVAVGGGNGGTATAGATVLRLTVDSAAVGERLPLRVVIPAGGGAGRPLVLFLHGRGQSDETFLTDAFFAALDGLGDRAPIVAFPYGGDHSYWHDRGDGAWGRYVVREALPLAIERSGADGARVAIGGISMGGFGAYDIARLHPKRFCAVGGHSPALWTESGQSAPGAFDDAADFERHDVIGKAHRFVGLRVWLDSGRSDPFLAGDQAFAAALDAAGADANVHYWSGGHESVYWDRHFKHYLRFYARALGRCQR
jgi:S-formylglutathione hydrolase FrmB